MSDTAFTNTAINHAIHRPGKANVLATAFVWMGRAKQRRMLKDMEPHRLADLGITQEQALREAAKPFWQA